LWDNASGRLLHSLKHTSRLWSLAWSSDGQTLAAGDQAGFIRYWQPASGKPLERINARVGAVKMLAWAKGQPRLAISSEDTVRVWEPRGLGPALKGRSATWLDARTLTCLHGERIRFWDADKGQPVSDRDFVAHRGHAYRAATSPNG